MLYGTVPFKANNMTELHKMIIKGNYKLKDDISAESRDLLKQLLEINPAKRISIAEVLAHPWLQNIQEQGLDLFTDSEKEIMRNEFTYNDTRRYNRNEGDELFTEHNLESTQNALLKNVSTKSVILAPFNSTVSHLSQDDPQSEPSPVKKNAPELEPADMYKKGEVLKFAGRVRDADRQYEQNNNCELDNGVYNKFYGES